MNAKTTIGLALALFCLMSFPTKAQTKYQIVTENYPPYNYESDGEIQGCCTEVVRAILDRIDMDIPIKLMDWNSAYHFAMHEPGGIVYSLTRTKARETLFRWVGPIARNEWVFFARKGRGIKIHNLNDAKKYVVGTYYNDVCEEFLYEHDFKKIACSDEDKLNPDKLMNGKIDLWLVADRISGRLLAKQAGVNPDELEMVYMVRETPLYIGFNRDVPVRVVNKFQAALNEIKKEGIFKKIMENPSLSIITKPATPKPVPVQLKRDAAFQLPPALLDRLNSEAKRRGTTPDALVEEALSTYLKKSP